MMITMLIIITAIMLVTTITLYHTLWQSWATHWIVMLVHKSFILSLAFNFTISLGIAFFTGEGMSSGAANLIASALFAMYVEMRKAWKPLKKPRWTTGFFGRIYGYGPPIRIRHRRRRHAHAH